MYFHCFFFFCFPRLKKRTRQFLTFPPKFLWRYYSNAFGALWFLQKIIKIHELHVYTRWQHVFERARFTTTTADDGKPAAVLTVFFYRTVFVTRPRWEAYFHQGGAQEAHDGPQGGPSLLSHVPGNIQIWVIESTPVIDRKYFIDLLVIQKKLQNPYRGRSIWIAKISMSDNSWKNSKDAMTQKKWNSSIFTRISTVSGTWASPKVPLFDWFFLIDFPRNSHAKKHVFQKNLLKPMN